jgi:hypothetical protein
MPCSRLRQKPVHLRDRLEAQKEEVILLTFRCFPAFLATESQIAFMYRIGEERPCAFLVNDFVLLPALAPSQE